MGRLVEFAPAPGIVKDITGNSATGHWVDCDKVRFRKGFPEKIGGWVRYTTEAFVGVCRALYSWATLDDSILTAIGTHLKYYVEEGGTLTDITPIRSSVTLGTDPFATVNGSGVVTVTHTAHGAATNDYVTFSGAVDTNGITAAQLNLEFQVTVIDADSYTITTAGTASSTGSGGGSSIDADYQINTGASSAVYGSGWSAGAWSRGTWSSAASATTLQSSIRLWTQDAYGEDLLFAPRYGEIYRYDSSVGGRAEAISNEGSANEVPTVVTEVLVAPNERIVFALGCNAIGSADHDELLIRWSDYENYLEWEPTSTTAAGGFRLSAGSRIITGIRARQEILVWTDVAMFGIQFAGNSEEVYQSYLIDPNVNIIGPLAKASLNGVTYWMGDRGFYAYDGRVTPLPCPLEDFVFDNIDEDSRAKIVCGTNLMFNEVWWIFPSGGGTEPCCYVVFNPLENVWFHGTLTRTAWLDRGLYNRPRGASTDGYIYVHEQGVDDGSTTPVTAINSYLTSAPVEIGGSEEIGRGDRIAFVNRMIPDVTFRTSTGSPTLTFTFRQKNYPGSETFEEDTSIAKGVTVDRYTGKKSIRLRARAIAMKVSNEEVGADWRLGTQRFETRTDGRKT